MKLTSRRRRAALGVALAVGAGALVLVTTTSRVDAHKGITSKYTYNDDVFPILRDKCGRCHVSGGVAPMSLMSYRDEGGGAVAWAESIRENLVAESMPPWYADPIGPAVRNNHILSPKDLDILVTWATGGTPQGDLHKMPPAMQAHAQWSLGKPDVVIPMDKAFTLPKGTMEDQVDVALPTGFTEAKWLRAADLLPETQSMVRQATISIENGPILAVWEPGDDAEAAPSGAAFKVAAGATLHVHIRYKKSWQDEQKDVSDKSTIGLYFTEEPLSGKSIEAVTIDGTGNEGTQKFSGSLTSGGRVLAIRPSLDGPYAAVDITAIAPSGRKVPLLKMRGARAEWPRRYWLADPIELPAQTKIEVAVTPADPDSGPLTPPVKSPLQVALDIVPQ